MHYSLRIVIPLILILFISINAALSFYINNKRSEKLLEQETVNNLTDNLTRLQSTLEKGFRINDFEWVKEEILSLSSDPNLS